MEDPELDAIRERKLQALRERVEAKQNAPSTPIDIGALELDATLDEHPLVLVDLWAPWCGPCRQMAPVLDQLADDLAGDLVIAKVNVDENPQVNQRFGVQGIPTLLLFHAGEIVERIVGARSKAQLESELAPYLP